MEFQTLVPHPEPQVFPECYESTSSTPYASAPSSPGRAPGPGPGFINSGFFYSAPASPMHFAMASSVVASSRVSSSTQPSSPDFEFSARFGPTGSGQTGSMSSADELFLNGKIRPMKLATHLERPQSLRRRTRSMSPFRHAAFGDDQTMCLDKDSGNKADTNNGTSCSSAGRISRRWVFLKDFLRSKSEGTNNNNNNSKLWSTISFSPAKEKKPGSNKTNGVVHESKNKRPSKTKAVNGIGKKRVPPSPHDLHYTAYKTQAEEMRKKTFLPYRQGLLGCLGFSSKGYSAMNGLAKALNPVSSRFISLTLDILLCCLLLQDIY
ncbi:hypothetical protein GOBAR_AA35645 [Gossypium barbadense]|uniref:Uncharacterized protein n=1 Tax=Gossypium barbadense TaxID=3634 RepID=A0A2P5W1V1_GOSBA|nr:hypothetical protein GOBAR_AA35645 [Gossypium barbadense]